MKSKFLKIFKKLTLLVSSSTRSNTISEFLAKTWSRTRIPYVSHSSDAPDRRVLLPTAKISQNEFFVWFRFLVFFRNISKFGTKLFHISIFPHFFLQFFIKISLFIDLNIIICLYKWLHINCISSVWKDTNDLMQIKGNLCIRRECSLRR